MPGPLKHTPLGWLQLRHKPLRLAVAIAGIAFAVLLIMMQLGFRSALFESAVRVHERLDYDIALFSVESVFIVRPQSFSLRRLYQARGFDEVTDAVPVYIAPTTWKNPWNNDRRAIFTMGLKPEDQRLAVPGLREQLPLVARQDAVLFDRRSRPEFGDVGKAIDADGILTTEVNNREVDVVGTFEMGTSFGIDGIIVTSDDNWLRIFPEHPRNEIHVGLLDVAETADVEAVRDGLRAFLPNDVLVMTKQDFVDRETAYWDSATPIGYVFFFGAVMGFVVGSIIVYQILFADVSEHFHEYATLRAIGYSNRFVVGIVMQQAVILAVLGFIPGVVVANWLYGNAAEATSLPIYLTRERAINVLVLTLVMCVISAVLAVRRLNRLDPADVF